MVIVNDWELKTRRLGLKRPFRQPRFPNPSTLYCTYPLAESIVSIIKELAWSQLRCLSSSRERV